jgi:hypothetical protein
MADILISALPTWTGTAADLRWFVMNNSGNTETFKFSGYTSPFRYVSDTLKNVVSLGTGTNTITSSGGNNLIGGGITNTISSTQLNGVIIGGNINSLINGGDSNAIIGGFSTTINGSSYCLNQNQGSTITSSANFAMIGGHQNSASGCFEGGMFGTYASSIVNGTDSTILGGRSNSINAGGACCGGNQIIGGDTNAINNTPGSKSTIIGGNANTIRNTSDRSSIIGGQSNTISGHTSAIMLGCSGRTSTTSVATFVENLVVFKYASLDYADDTAAAAGGVVLGQVYHTSGTLKIRIV